MRLPQIAIEHQRAVFGLLRSIRNKRHSGLAHGRSRPGLETRRASHASTARTAPLGPTVHRQLPVQTVTQCGRSQGDGFDESLHRCRRLFTPHNGLQDRPHVEKCRQFHLGRHDAALPHPGPGRRVLREIVARLPIHHRRGVEQVEQQCLVFGAHRHHIHI